MLLLPPPLPARFPSIQLSSSITRLHVSLHTSLCTTAFSSAETSATLSVDKQKDRDKYADENEDQNDVANSGRFENIAWSPSCPSPPLLTYLSTLELLQFDNPTSIWSFDPDMLRLRAEFLLLVQVLIDKVSASLRRDVDLDKIEKEKEKESQSQSEGFEEEKPELLDRNDDLKEGNGELGDCVRVLDRFLELGMRRLKPDVVMEGGEENTTTLEKVLIEVEEMVCLRKVIMDYADLFDALCGNIQRQLKGLEDGVDSGMAIMIRREEKVSVDSFEEEHKGVLSLIQKSVQLAHLDALKESVLAEAVFEELKNGYLRDEKERGRR